MAMTIAEREAIREANAAWDRDNRNRCPDSNPAATAGRRSRCTAKTQTEKGTTMTKRATKATTTKVTKAATKKPAERETTVKTVDELVTFALRLPRSERDAIHTAAGPGKASSWARQLFVAASRKDRAAVAKLLDSVVTSS